MTSVAAELTALASRAGDLFKAEDALKWAREHKNSALHSVIEWDDSKAAHEYRLHQMRRLIAIHVVDAVGERKLVSLSIDRSAGGGYRKVQDVKVNPELATVMLRDALHELQRTRQKYERVRALASVWTEVDKAVREHGAAAETVAKAS